MTAQGQQTTIATVGFLGPESRDLFADRLPAFQLALREAGFVEGRTVSIMYRWAEGQNSRLPALAADLIANQVAVIVAPGSTPAVFAAKSLTTTIPIVFFVGSDPVALGLVASLNRPGGNVTGVTTLNAEVVNKRLEYMRAVLPHARSVALLVNPTNPASKTEASEIQIAARMLGLELEVVHAINEHAFEAVFTDLAQRRIDMLVIGTDALFNTRGQQLGMLSVRNRLPAIHAWRAFATAGGLISFGSSISAGYRQVGIYTARLLRGEKASDLPVEQVSKLDLVLNLQTAKVLGLELPATLLARADAVIE